MPELKLSWLGTPIVELGGRLIKLEMRKVTALLAYLSLHQDGISREVMAAMFWPENDQPHALGSLRRTLSSLSTSLDFFQIHIDRETIRLPEGSQFYVDVLEFHRRIHEASLHHPAGEQRLCPECISLLEEAVRLCRGDFLEGLNLKDCPDFDEWQYATRESLRSELGQALEKLTQAYTVGRDWENAVQAARRWASMDMLNEAPQRELIRLYVESGQRSAALRHYEIFASHLNDELGQIPEPETTRLIELIRQSASDGQKAHEIPPSPAGLSQKKTEPLIKTKLFISPLRREMVPRRRLLELMDNGSQRALTLISAPAGFGKTTLLAHWAAHTGLPIAWFSIDEGDNDPFRFLSYLIAALDSAVQGVGDQYLDAYQSLQPSIQPALTGLINQLTGIAEEFVLILDDYQFIHSPDIHNALAYLLERMPPCLHLVIATRTDPPLPLARLRARDQLVELRAADLRFSQEESSGFLNQVMSLDLNGEDVSALETRTEGWIAGLQMAALAIRALPGSRSNPAIPAGNDALSQGETVSRFIQAFSGSHRYIMDYLGEEVLSRRSAKIQRFMLQTSILERFAGPLCDALTGMEGSQEILQELEKENLFLVPLDSERHWYRYHHLFAELLRYQLEKQSSTRQGPEGEVLAGVDELHRRAAVWFQENQFTGEAIAHYFAAGLPEKAAFLIESQAERMIFVTGQVYTLLGWLNALPAEIYRSTPHLYFARAMTLISRSEYAAASEVLETGEQTIRELPEAEAATLAGEIALIRGVLAQLGSHNPTIMREQALQAWDTLPQSNTMLRGLAAWLLGASYYWDGDPSTAEKHYQDAIQLCRLAGNRYFTLMTLVDMCNVLREQGKYKGAYNLIKETRLNLEREGRQAHPMLGQLLINLGQILLQWNRLDEAEHYMNQGIEMVTQDLPGEMLIFGISTLAYLKLAQGDREAAIQVAENCLMSLESLQLMFSSAVIRANLIRLWIYTGNHERIEEWLGTCGLSVADDIPYLREREYMALAVVLLWQRKSGEALIVLDKLAEYAGRSGRNGRRLYVLALKALALQQKGDTGNALTLLGQTLAAAQAEGYMRIYLDEGQPMADLIRAGLVRGLWRDAPLEGFVKRLLRAFPSDDKKLVNRSSMKAPSTAPAAQHLVEPLSEREMEVLLLAASGLSNLQIAKELYLSAGTIKTHLHNIYGKLGAASRVQAIHLAREEHILD